MIFEIFKTQCSEKVYNCNLKTCGTAALYKENIINKLIDIMKNEEWNLYNSKGVQWAIDMCDFELKSNTFKSKKFIVRLKDDLQYIAVQINTEENA